MITITAVGFIAEKPELQMVGTNKLKVEFDVIWGRSHKGRSGWETAYERATFVAWDSDAERLASSLDKGSEVSCTGTQETSKWTGGDNRTHSRVRYRLTAWDKRAKSSARSGETPQHQNRQTPLGASSSTPPQGSGRAFPIIEPSDDGMIPM